MSKEGKSAHAGTLAAMAAGTVCALGFTLHSALGGGLFRPGTSVPDPVPPKASTASVAPSGDGTLPETAAGVGGDADSRSVAAPNANPFAPVFTETPNGSMPIAGNATSGVQPAIPIPPKFGPLPGLAPAPVAPPGPPELVGTIEGGRTPGAVLRLDGRTMVVAVGGTIGAWRVRAVETGAVVVDHRGWRIRLTKQRRTGGEPPVEPPGVNPTGGAKQRAAIDPSAPIPLARRIEALPDTRSPVHRVRGAGIGCHLALVEGGAAYGVANPDALTRCDEPDPIRELPRRRVVFLEPSESPVGREPVRESGKAAEARRTDEGTLGKGSARARAEGDGVSEPDGA